LESKGIAKVGISPVKPTLANVSVDTLGNAPKMHAGSEVFPIVDSDVKVRTGASPKSSAVIVHTSLIASVMFEAVIVLVRSNPPDSVWARLLTKLAAAEPRADKMSYLSLIILPLLPFLPFKDTIEIQIGIKSTRDLPLCENDIVTERHADTLRGFDGTRKHQFLDPNYLL
jgi:hypothetical protein